MLRAPELGHRPNDHRIKGLWRIHNPLIGFLLYYICLLWTQSKVEDTRKSNIQNMY